MTFARIMYCCTFCADNNREICGYFGRDDLRVMPDGRWLCNYCFDDIDQAEPGNDDENENKYWSDFPEPPEYGPIALQHQGGK